MIKLSSLFFILTLLFTYALQAEDNEEQNQAYWDYGIGLGAVHYEHYPGANQFADLALPSPTFQYRGKVLRADDQEGAHLYLLKSAHITLEMSGVGYPALDSANNRTRQGMDNLPWMLALGPQLVVRHWENLDLALGAYQVVTTDFQMTRFQGGIFEARGTWKVFETENGSTGKLSASVKYATQELQALYYEVPADKVTSERSRYEANEGLMSQDITYLQTIKSGRLSFLFGTSLALYDQAANRTSPLHKSNANLTGAIGINYVLGGSSRPAVPEEDTSGVINRLRRNRDLRSE